MNVTRRQHYVWRHYLQGWAVNGTVAVVRKDGASFPSNPMNIAQERDFYRLPILSVEDERFALMMISAPGVNPKLVESNTAWLHAFATPSRLRRNLKLHGVAGEALENAIRDAEIQTEESLHSKIEGSAIGLLAYLRAGDCDFWNDDAHAMDFIFFLAVQHFRTKAMRERVLALQKTDSRIDSRFDGHLERTWPIIRIVLASNLSWSLFADRARWHIRVLSASGQHGFITGDQPILNLLPQTGKPDDLALYYPVSPESAVLFELRDVESPIGPKNLLNDATVEDLNRKVIDGIHEQAFGSNLSYLRQLMGTSEPA